MSTPAQILRNREEWLNEVAKRILPWYKELGWPVPSYRIGVGFPSTGKRGKAIGECWSSEHSADQHHEIILHVSQAEPLDVAATLAHELTHAAVGLDKKHGKVFKKVATKIGLTGKMRATVPGPEFVENIKPFLDEVGPFPHASLNATGASSRGPRQKGRMLKAECPECKYIIRASRSCLEIGIPQCPNEACSLSSVNNDEYIPMLAEFGDDEDVDVEIIIPTAKDISEVMDEGLLAGTRR